MGGAPATAMTIKQSATELTIDRTTPMGAQTVVYKLDGTESVNAMGMGSAKSTASWSGSTLVLTIQTTRTTPFGTQSRNLVYKKN